MCTSWPLFEGRVFCANLLAREKFCLIWCLLVHLQPWRSIVLYASKSISQNAGSFLFARTYNEIRKKTHPMNLVYSLRRLLNWSQTSLKACLLFVPRYRFPLLVWQGWPGGGFSAESTWGFPSLDKDTNIDKWTIIHKYTYRSNIYYSPGENRTIYSRCTRSLGWCKLPWMWPKYVDLCC